MRLLFLLLLVNYFLGILWHPVQRGTLKFVRWNPIRFFNRLHLGLIGFLRWLIAGSIATLNVRIHWVGLNHGLAGLPSHYIRLAVTTLLLVLGGS